MISNLGISIGDKIKAIEKCHIIDYTKTVKSNWI